MYLCWKRATVRPSVGSRAAIAETRSDEDSPPAPVRAPHICIVLADVSILVEIKHLICERMFKLKLRSEQDSPAPPAPARAPHICISKTQIFRAQNADLSCPKRRFSKFIVEVAGRYGHTADHQGIS